MSKSTHALPRADVCDRLYDLRHALGWRWGFGTAESPQPLPMSRLALLLGVSRPTLCTYTRPDDPLPAPHRVVVVVERWEAAVAADDAWRRWQGAHPSADPARQPEERRPLPPPPYPPYRQRRPRWHAGRPCRAAAQVVG